MNKLIDYDNALYTLVPQGRNIYDGPKQTYDRDTVYQLRVEGVRKLLTGFQSFEHLLFTAKR